MIAEPYLWAAGMDTADILPPLANVDRKYPWSASSSQIGTYPTAERASPDRPRQTGCTQGCLCLAFHTISAVYSQGFAGGRRPSLFAPSLCSTTRCKLHPPFIRLKIRKKTKHHRSYEHGTPGVPPTYLLSVKFSFTTPGEKICYQGNGYSKAVEQRGVWASTRLKNLARPDNAWRPRPRIPTGETVNRSKISTRFSTVTRKAHRPSSTCSKRGARLQPAVQLLVYVFGRLDLREEEMCS